MLKRYRKAKENIDSVRYAMKEKTVSEGMTAERDLWKKESHCTGPKCLRNKTRV